MKVQIAKDEQIQKCISCCEYLDKKINDNFDGYYLISDFIDAVIAEYGAECVKQVIASTIRQRAYDRRICRENKKWAATVLPLDIIAEYKYTLDSHSCLVNSVANKCRDK